MSSVYAFGPFTLDRTRRAVLRDEETVALTPKAFDILTVLVENGGRVVSKDRLMRAVWPDTVVEESNLTFQMSALRKALGERREGERYIATVPGQGYQLALPVRAADDSVRAADETEIVIEERSAATIVVEETSRWSHMAVAVAALVAIAALAIALWPRVSEPVAAPPGVRSIAVLPFKPIVPAQRDEALELGMADALITRLSAFTHVAPLTAVRGYTAVDQDPLEAGRALGADAVLDGSILNANGRIRINARLLRVADAKQLWQGQYDNEYGDVLAVQDSISERLASELAVNLSPADQQRLRRQETTNVEAYRAYTIGRMHMFSVRSDRIDEAIRHFERAVAIDPQYARAWAMLGGSHATLPIAADRPPLPSFDRAREAVLRAIAIDGDLPEAHSVIATIAFWHDWDWRRAEEHFRRATSLHPYDGWTRIRYAHLLSNIGRHADARKEAQRAMQDEPLSPMINTLAGQFLLHEEQNELALQQLQHTASIAPDFWIVHLNLGKANERLRRYADARRHYETALVSSAGNIEPLSMIGHLHAIEGREREARAVIAQLLEARRTRYVPATKIALPYAGLGATDEAIRWLETACQERDVSLVFLNVNPRWDALRADARFTAIERCVNLPAVSSRR